MIQFTFLRPDATEDHLGLIPAFFVERDPRPAVDQINERYAHGGGWFDLKVGERWFTMDSGGVLRYPEDPPMPPLAEAMLHDCGTPEHKGERILIYSAGFVAVVQGDNSFRVARLD